MARRQGQPHFTTPILTASVVESTTFVKFGMNSGRRMVYWIALDDEKGMNQRFKNSS